MIKNVDQFLETVFTDFTQNQRKVLLSRFGLKTGKAATLQAVGDELGITRERVRQIQEQAMKKLGGALKVSEGPFVQLVVAHLAAVGGVRSDVEFIKDIRQKFFAGSNTKHLDQKIRFVLFAAGAPSYRKEDDTTNAYWYADDAAHKKFTEFVKHATSVFKTTDRQEFFDRKVYLAVAKDPASAHLLSIPKHFGVNVFGDVGLVEWPEIAPKTVRDKAYLVLRKSSSPLHFEDISKNISKLGIDKKTAHVQTVHNELIKDDRFVLVGRGIYGLREQGYQPGTVREVVARLLKKNGPLQAHEVVTRVNQERFLKENTILLALQNRKFFKRLEDGRYHTKEA
ncbi:MAG: sigma factor-like helix-turn-helix DNA-binding protein [bacterium]|nr:sigma factor-like helix-turn-helix DNA-binding protein [bacterium]